jgi:hypothetical protein
MHRKDDFDEETNIGHFVKSAISESSDFIILI